MPRFAPVRLLVVVCVLAAGNSFAVENATPTVANSDPTYQQLRNISLGNEVISVNNITLRRDAATFHLNSGIFCFVTPVQGKVTGAVFVGEGSLTLDPPISIEHSTLKLLTREDEFYETFSHLVLRFTDATYDEVRRRDHHPPAAAMPGYYVTARTRCATIANSSTTSMPGCCRT